MAVIEIEMQMNGYWFTFERRILNVLFIADDYGNRVGNGHMVEFAVIMITFTSCTIDDKLLWDTQLIVTQQLWECLATS